MVFWRKKKNEDRIEEELRDDKLLHPDGEPELEPSIDQDNACISEDLKENELEESESDIIDELDIMPVPSHTSLDDVQEREELSDDSEEGGWLSRLTKGLSKSTNKITKGIGDALTKSKLDQETLDGLEEVLVSADLGPKTASRIIEEFAKDRFGKEISEEEIREALAGNIESVLSPVANFLTIEKPEKGPFVILFCGVNGTGKTTTIGKYAHYLKTSQHLKVMIAAGDTFRAAAVEQLAEWAKRGGAELYQKDLGADSASVAFEAYEKAENEGYDVLMIDTAGRLQNKANLMEELTKIIRVLKKKDESLPHATLLVLDATTGQNAFSQLDTFKEAVNVSGLIVTKLDGSAKGGVLVGLADQYGIDVHAIGVGEQIEDLQPFSAKDYARSLMGLE
ncbi:MAG: signal recognition particle-docking protein FtsY [Alphaproteobacteria bacterium]|nr:signal recognition particle-docking protein FtsY [Alphaproteobacteria bacterium]